MISSGGLAACIFLREIVSTLQSESFDAIKILPCTLFVCCARSSAPTSKRHNIVAHSLRARTPCPTANSMGVDPIGGNE
jgi:hypothetical protein